MLRLQRERTRTSRLVTLSRGPLRLIGQAGEGQRSIRQPGRQATHQGQNADRDPLGDRQCRQGPIRRQTMQTWTHQGQTADIDPSVKQPVGLTMQTTSRHADTPTHHAGRQLVSLPIRHFGKFPTGRPTTKLTGQKMIGPSAALLNHLPSSQSSTFLSCRSSHANPLMPILSLVVPSLVVPSLLSHSHSHSHYRAVHNTSDNSSKKQFMLYSAIRKGNPIRGGCRQEGSQIGLEDDRTMPDHPVCRQVSG